MPLFFIISGYLQAHHNKTVTAKEIITAGAKSLMYPYCTFGIILILWWIVFGAVFHTHPEEPLCNIVLRMLSTYGYHTLWFLPTLFVASVISKTYKYKTRWVLLAASVTVGCILSYVANSTLWCTGYWRYVVMYIGRIALALSFVEIGRLGYTWIQNMSSKTALLIMIVAASISLILYKENISVSMVFSRIGNPVLYYTTAYAGSLWVLLFSKMISEKRIGRLLRYWGKNSPITMALHMDISIEIAWVILGITNLSTMLSFRNASIVAILIELIVLAVIIEAINRYAAFLIHWPEIHKKDSTKAQ